VKSHAERRQYPRVYLPMAASLFSETAKIGDYLVRDLSAGGALFTNGPSIPAGTSLRVILVGHSVEGLALPCVARRSEGGAGDASNVAVEFREVPPTVQDLLQRLVLRALEQLDDPAIVAVHPKPLVLASLAGDIVELGQRIILATTPLETVRWLCDLETTVQAILVDQSHDPNFGRAILHLAKEEFPAVRRIALCEGTSKDELVQTLAAVDADDVLDVPWTPSGLAASLDSENQRPEPRSPRPDAT
jgi:hypothetical protein